MVEIDNNSLYKEIAKRTEGVYTKEEQERIKKGRVAIAGIGCDGGMDAYILTRMGIGHLSLIDFDSNELSNLNRQPMATYSTIGIPKVYSAKSILKDLNPTVEVEAVNTKIDEENVEVLIKGHDVILQGMDSVVARIILHRAAKKLGIPSITMTGQPPYRSIVSTLMPNGLLYEELFGIDFMIGKSFKENPNLEEKVNLLKYERAENAAKSNASPNWLNNFKAGKAGWGITPERAYLTSIYQVHECLSIITGRQPKAVSPKAYVSDLNGLGEFGHPESLVALLDPPDGRWDYKMF